MQIEQLIMSFQTAYRRKYNTYPYSLKNVKNTKWWACFETFYNKSKIKDGDECEFISFLFNSWDDKNGKLLPYVLVKKDIIEIEKAFNASKNKNVKTLTEYDYIKETFVQCKKWCSVNGITENKLGVFLKDERVHALVERGRYYLPIFLFCKEFIDKHGISEEEALKKSSIRAFYKKVYDKIKEALGDSFVE